MTNQINPYTHAYDQSYEEYLRMRQHAALSQRASLMNAAYNSGYAQLANQNWQTQITPQTPTNPLLLLTGDQE